MLVLWKLYITVSNLDLKKEHELLFLFFITSLVKAPKLYFYSTKWKVIKIGRVYKIFLNEVKFY